MNMELQSKSMSEYVSRLIGMQDNLGHGNIDGRVVADLATNDSNIHKAILEAGARLCYIVGDGECNIDDPRLIRVTGKPWDANISDVEVAFFDSRALPDFDPIGGATRLMAHMRQVLVPQGLVFAVISTGNVHAGFDVFNSIIQTPIGLLPSSEYLFDELLKDCAIRMLDWLPSEFPTVTTRLLRLTHKKPSLLLILGRSQSGKTSLARDFIQLDRHMHVSNDYIYCEIARMRDMKQSHLSADVLENIGDGGGEACGRFNRELEKSFDLLQQYLVIVKSLLPRNKQLISMDLDLIAEEQIEVIKRFFSTAGYSVWVVSR